MRAQAPALCGCIVKPTRGPVNRRVKVGSAMLQAFGALAALSFVTILSVLVVTSWQVPEADTPFERKPGMLASST